ncbi:arginine--tRNA ligase [Candidatus Pacearchaeota archaeon CG10_big_fil_rev_8_21_14_0_10_35_13]|nr:MAG: arginine--tRNA ligase [Candidatus Pacearchaeota archaeon CG10_big_fil_rev_8_21_14_0_10_35_13]
MRHNIIGLLVKHTKLSFKEVDSLLEVPPNQELGDFAFPCFVLAKTLKKAPQMIAQGLSLGISKELSKVKSISEVRAVGPYINFFINNNLLAEGVITGVLKEGEDYGKRVVDKGEVMVEFPSPNTNKPLHVGHLRNMSLGESVCRVLEFRGNNVLRANLYNDRGVHICKSMLAYQKWGNGATPASTNKKPDHFIGDFYVMFAQEAKKNPQLEVEVQEMLKRWEDGDKKTVALWKKMNKWAFDGMGETFKTLGIKHDKNYYESDFYDKGKSLVLDGLKKGLFKKKDDGAVFVDLSKYNLGEKILLRADGTSIYVTQDIALSNIKYDDYKMDKSIIVTGNEQEYYFKGLFKILEVLGFKFSNYNLSYGMVNLPDGKIKSREGAVADADDLISEVKSLVIEELKTRYKLSKKELESRALKIALSAIKYFLLKVGSSRDMIFNPKESISFEGNTGPYLLYSYARANSILEKSGKKLSKKLIIPKVLSASESSLIKLLESFPLVVDDSYDKLDPSILANYSYSLAKSFNEFYHSSPVIGSPEENFRLSLVKAFMITLKNSLWLLGIDTIDEM